MALNRYFIFCWVDKASLLWQFDINLDNGFGGKIVFLFLLSFSLLFSHLFNVFPVFFYPLF